MRFTLIDLFWLVTMLAIACGAFAYLLNQLDRSSPRPFGVAVAWVFLGAGLGGAVGALFQRGLLAFA
jgi:hypothetical protein